MRIKIFINVPTCKLKKISQDELKEHYIKKLSEYDLEINYTESSIEDMPYGYNNCIERYDNIKNEEFDRLLRLTFEEFCNNN